MWIGAFDAFDAFKAFDGFNCEFNGPEIIII